MKLYFNGDSFVAGCELGDDVLDGYPGLLSWPMDTTKHELHKEWLRRTHVPTTSPKHHSNRTEKFSLIGKLELERAFPNKVQQLLNIPVINHAMSGASMDNIVRHSMTELYNLRKENPNEEIIAIIGTTYPGRSEIPYDELNRIDLHNRKQDWICISGNYSIDCDSDYITSVRKFKVLYETHYHNLVNFYKNIILLQDFCKLNNIELHWVATFDNVSKDYWALDEYSDRPDINMLMEYANLEYTLDMKEIIVTEFAGQNVVCPGGHFGEIIHERTAQEIVRLLHERAG